MDKRQEALEYSLRLLKYCNRTKKEIEQKLKQKKFTPSEIKYAIEQLTQMGYINDTAFAEMYIHTQLRKNKGINLIKHELYTKGINTKTIAAALVNTSPTAEEETAQIKNLIKKRLNRYGHLSKEVLYRRIYSYLLRRGFPCEKVTEILTQVLEL